MFGKNKQSYKSNTKLNEKQIDSSPKYIQNSRSPKSTVKLFSTCNKSPGNCREAAYLQAVKRQATKKKAPSRPIA